MTTRSPLAFLAFGALNGMTMGVALAGAIWDWGSAYVYLPCAMAASLLLARAARRGRGGW